MYYKMYSLVKKETVKLSNKSLSLLTFYCNVGSWLYLVKPESWKAVVLDSRSDSSGELVQMNEMFGHVRGQHRVDQTLPHLLVRLHVQILKNRRDTYMVW